MTDTKAPWHARLALVLAILLPFYFMAAALGTKFGLWDWTFGLGTMLASWGPIVLGGVALIALVSLIVCVIKPPRNGWGKALLALLVPVVIFGALGYVRSQAESIPPIHDVTTAPDNPPQFSEGWILRRDNTGANPINDYATPLGELEPWQGERFAELAGKTHADIMAESYPELAPLPLGSNSASDAQDAVLEAMQAMGATETDAVTGMVYGTFETFWFGFEDDVAVRIGPDQIDFRSVSRVGLSDLGKNAERIAELRAATEERLR